MAKNVTKINQSEVRANHRANKGGKKMKNEINRPKPYTKELSTINFVVLSSNEVGKLSIKYRYPHTSISEAASLFNARFDEEGNVLSLDFLNKKMVYRERTIKEIMAIASCDEAAARNMLALTTKQSISIMEQNRVGTYIVENNHYYINGDWVVVPLDMRHMIQTRSFPVDEHGYFTHAIECLAETVAEQEEDCYVERAA